MQNITRQSSYKCQATMILFTAKTNCFTHFSGFGIPIIHPFRRCYANNSNIEVVFPVKPSGMRLFPFVVYRRFVMIDSRSTIHRQILQIRIVDKKNCTRLSFSIFLFLWLISLFTNHKLPSQSHCFNGMLRDESANSLDYDTSMHIRIFSVNRLRVSIASFLLTLFSILLKFHVFIKHILYPKSIKYTYVYICLFVKIYALKLGAYSFREYVPM